MQYDQVASVICNLLRLWLTCLVTFVYILLHLKKKLGSQFISVPDEGYSRNASSELYS